MNTFNSFKKLLLVMALVLSANGIASAQKGPQWLGNAVFYQIYPSSYMDSDGNGIGDLPGITSRLDYIQSLGVNALWLNPIFESGWFDGGYDIIDFYKVDPRFGTNSDLVKLVTEAHKRGIKVCLDLVAGHTSDKCAWFKQSRDEDANSRYSDYYIWTNDISQADKDDIVKRHQQPNPLSSTIGKYVEADAPRAKYYQKNFFECQPALNYGFAKPDPAHPWEQPVDAPGPKATRQELKNIMAFWMDKGVDGFRVDMANSLVKNDPDEKETCRLWTEMRSWMNKEYPQCVLISEWSNPTHSIPAGFHIDFALPWGKVGYQSLFLSKNCYFDKSGQGNIDDLANKYGDIYDKTKNLGYIAFPTANHDFHRPNYGTRNTPEQLKVAITFVLTMPGVPFVYYGDELGMKYIMNLPSKEGSNERAGTRTPMQWDKGATAGFSTCTPEKLYLPVDTENGKITVTAEEKDPKSLLNYVRSLIKLRHSSEALNNEGDWQLLSDAHHPYPMVFKRSAGNEAYVVALNPSETKVTATIATQGCSKAKVVSASGKGSYKCGKKNDVLQLAPFSAMIYKIQ
jgi:maltose alpha-D-glucosyltransferase/alpha-amylase